MTDQIVITEKTSQAKDVRAAVGSRYGDVLPAEGHLFDLVEPEDVVPEWKRWSPILLRPEGLYGTRLGRDRLKECRRSYRSDRNEGWLKVKCVKKGRFPLDLRVAARGKAKT
jgi:DNA topoisomerase III